MQMVIDRDGIRIVPQSKQDEAYIEDTLGLKNGGDSIKLVRENAMGLHCLSQLSTHPYPFKTGV